MIWFDCEGTVAPFEQQISSSPKFLNLLLTLIQVSSFCTFVPLCSCAVVTKPSDIYAPPFQAAWTEVEIIRNAAIEGLIKIAVRLHQAAVLLAVHDAASQIQVTSSTSLVSKLVALKDTILVELCDLVAESIGISLDAPAGQSEGLSLLNSSNIVCCDLSRMTAVNEDLKEGIGGTLEGKGSKLHYFLQNFPIFAVNSIILDPAYSGNECSLVYAAVSALSSSNPVSFATDCMLAKLAGPFLLSSLCFLDDASLSALPYLQKSSLADTFSANSARSSLAKLDSKSNNGQALNIFDDFDVFDSRLDGVSSSAPAPTTIWGDDLTSFLGLHGGSESVPVVAGGYASPGDDWTVNFGLVSTETSAPALRDSLGHSGPFPAPDPFWANTASDMQPTPRAVADSFRPPPMSTNPVSLFDQGKRSPGNFGTDPFEASSVSLLAPLDPFMTTAPSSADPFSQPFGSPQVGPVDSCAGSAFSVTGFAPSLTSSTDPFKPTGALDAAFAPSVVMSESGTTEGTWTPSATSSSATTPFDVYGGSGSFSNSDGFTTFSPSTSVASDPFASSAVHSFPPFVPSLPFSFSEAGAVGGTTDVTNGFAGFGASFAPSGKDAASGFTSFVVGQKEEARDPFSPMSLQDTNGFLSNSVSWGDSTNKLTGEPSPATPLGHHVSFI
jgi:hypothetical protein